MPDGTVREDLNKTGDSFRNGNPVPAADPSFDSNPIPQTNPNWKGNPVPISDATLNSNPVNWTPSPSHFGNIIGGAAPISAFLLQEDGSSLFTLENGTGSILLESGSISEEITQLPAGTPAQSTDLTVAARGSSNVSLSVNALQTAIPEPLSDSPAFYYIPFGQLNRYNGWSIGGPVQTTARQGTVATIQFFVDAKLIASKFAYMIFRVDSQTVYDRYAIYSGDRQTLLWDSGQHLMVSNNVGGIPTINISPAVTLDPGAYWFAWSDSDSLGVTYYTFGSLGVGSGYPGGYQVDSDWSTAPSSSSGGVTSASVGASCQTAFPSTLPAPDTTRMLVPIAMLGS